MENRSGDEITSTTGDGAKNSITGKENRQDVTENQGSNIVNNYIDRNNPDRAARRQSITLDERLDRLEVDNNERQREITRLKSLVDGDPAIRFRGLLDQIADSTKSDQEWKRTTEKWIESAEKRFETLEDKKDVIFSSKAAWLYILIGIMAAVILFLLLTRGQTAGQALIPSIENLATLLQGEWYA
jgi:hypothetical protein